MLMKLYFILATCYISLLSIIYMRQKKILLLIAIKKYNKKIMILNESIYTIKNKMLIWESL